MLRVTGFPISKKIPNISGKHLISDENQSLTVVDLDIIFSEYSIVLLKNLLTVSRGMVVVIFRLKKPKDVILK